MIVGTAGHIDHGKTALVRALTGVDTDRLPEEKARGISIELGYAYAPLPDDEVLGFVDVPGHEKFVHTMLAGVTGIDFALLVVAADDGVMPQSREHLDILDQLGIDAGALVISKVDAVDASRVADVERHLRALTASTALARSPVFAVSARTGAGIDALKHHLVDRARSHRPAVGHGHFRLAVDRTFTLPGHGTVVTGTVHAGEVRTGASLMIASSGREVRVRSLHAQNRESERGVRGQRCALNLAGVSREEIARGDWIVAPEIALSTERFDARLRILAGETGAMRSGVSVHVHLGAAHGIGHIVVLDGATDDADRDSLAPGTSRLAQIVLQGRLSAWHGDRFVIRDASASRTLGGGRVLDPFAPARYRRTPERLAELRALEADEAAARVAMLAAQSPRGVDVRRLERSGTVRDIGECIERLDVRRVRAERADFIVGKPHWGALQRHLGTSLEAFHAHHVDELGPDIPRLKRIAFPRLDDALYRALLADMVAAAMVRQHGPWVHLPGRSNAPPAQERALIERVLPRLLDRPFDPPWVRDLAKSAAQPEPLVRAALIRASKRGEVFQVVRDLFYHPRAVRDLATLAIVLERDDGNVRTGAFRDRTELGRKRAIQVLEFFDRVGFTRRVREARVVRSNALLSIGIADDATSMSLRPPAAAEQIS